MKAFTLSFFAILFASFSAQAAAPRGFPDIPPDAGSSMYRTSPQANLLLAVESGDGLDAVVKLGERNLQWLQYINSFRPANDKLSLTSKDTQRGIPIDNPNEYNVEIVQKKLIDLRPQIPAEMQKIIFDNAEFTKEPPLAIPDYLKWSLELDRVYQGALRWRMMAPYLGLLADRRHNDLRGWYFLSRLEGRADKLKNFARLEDKEKEKIRFWLVSLCYNNEDVDNIENCASTVNAMIGAGSDLEDYYESKADLGKNLFVGYFTIPSGVARSEIRYEDGKQPRLIAPFLDPVKDDVRSFLQVNIQDEWRFGDWHLELPFQPSGDFPHVIFQPGVTPHVNRIGGDEITMNAQQPLTEYDAQWTIRHEYGHVLGFPDCYVEFYESERNVIVNYQFDVDNLMCSRRGHIQARHVSELKRSYQR